MRLSQLQGYWAPGRKEPVAHCPTHGQPPYNDSGPGADTGGGDGPMVATS